MSVKKLFYSFCKRKLGNWERIIFWEDVWIGNQSLAEQFPNLYRLTFSHNFTVAKVFSRLGGGGGGAVRLRTLIGAKPEKWEAIKDLFKDIQLSVV